jgi:hypothetical protein
MRNYSDESSKVWLGYSKALKGLCNRGEILGEFLEPLNEARQHPCKTPGILWHLTKSSEEFRGSRWQCDCGQIWVWRTFMPAISFKNDVAWDWEKDESNK